MLVFSGVLDADTMEMMNKPRCGLPDNMGHSNSARRKRYAAMARWATNDLSWRINSYTNDLTSDDTKSIMGDALKVGTCVRIGPPDLRICYAMGYCCIDKPYFVL